MNKQALKNSHIRVHTRHSASPQTLHKDIADALLEWFSANQRPLPWRTDYEPYKVWLSEIMLQQTQMERGAEYFKRWIKRFPNMKSVAEAKPEILLKYWEGLGYYSRVRNMQKAAQIVVAQHGGQLPASRDSLLALPGIG